MLDITTTELADELVGGLYGVGVGGVFTGESMFHLASDASKVALVDLTARLTQDGGWLIDVQMVTPHLASLGARDLPRDDFLDLLASVRGQGGGFSLNRDVADISLADIVENITGIKVNERVPDRVIDEAVM
mgnify:CR=1 FL=1